MFKCLTFGHREWSLINWCLFFCSVLFSSCLFIHLTDWLMCRDIITRQICQFGLFVKLSSQEREMRYAYLSESWELHLISSHMHSTCWFIMYLCIYLFIPSFVHFFFRTQCGVTFVFIHARFRFYLFIDSDYHSSHLNHELKTFFSFLTSYHLHPQVTSEFVSNKSRILELLEAERAKAAMRLDEVRQRRAEMTTPTKRRRGEGSSGVGIRKDLYKVALLLREANKISQYLKKNLVSFPTFFCVNHRVWVFCLFVFCQADHCGVFIHITCIQYNDTLIHTSV